MAKSAKEYWTMILILILSGIAWMIGSKKLFDYIDKRRDS